MKWTQCAHVVYFGRISFQWCSTDKILLAACSTFSLIAQVIIEMRALWLVVNYVISRYNYLARGDYNTEALTFKMAAAQFLDVSKEESSKMKENAVALIITWAIILKQLFSSSSGNIVE